jgi:hypothetical protein
VYAFSGDGSGPALKAFADQGITGLRGTETIRRYRNSWQNSIDAGLSKPVAPGDQVDLPDAAWVEVADRDPTRYVRRDEKAVARSLERQDLDAEVMAQNLDQRTAEIVISRLAEDHPEMVAQSVTQAVAHAIASNPVAIEMVEEAAIEARVEAEPYDEDEARRETRRHASRTAQTMRTSLIAGAIRNATSAMAEAILCQEEFGMDSPEERAEVAAELERLEHYIAMFKTHGELSSADREWLAAMGIGQ